MPVDERGCYDELVVGLNLLPDPEEFVGVHIFKANERILELLGESLLKGYKSLPTHTHTAGEPKSPLYIELQISGL